jgi:maltooligosyltrehalose trehalohydrolase
LGPDAFVIRYFGHRDGDNRLLVVNLGRDLDLKPSPEPLIAPSEGRRWALFWTSEHPRYGGWSTPAWPTEGNWRIQGEVALILKPGEMELAETPALDKPS